MTDPRFKKLAKLLVEYSTALEKGERVLLDMIDVPDEFSVELMRASRNVGATPLIEVRHTRINREIIRETNDAHSLLVRDIEMFRMKKVQAYIAIRGSANASEASDVPSHLLALYSKVLRPVLNWMTPSTESLTGQENTSPSGILRSPLHILAPMFLMLKRRSVPGPFNWTRSAVRMRFSNGTMAFAILG